MSDFLSSYRKWREEEERHRQFLIDHGFNPDSSQHEIAREFLARSTEDRERIHSDWHDFLLGGS